MALNPADIATVSRLLDEGLELPPAEREAWLQALPADQQRHAATLREMLARQAQLETAGPLGSMPRLVADDAVAHAGDVVGPYRLLREIGRGGMGSVWLAERADGSFQRQVAVKLPRVAWGDGLALRMRRERDIGALLEHPNVARLYDAGVDERGRPYLAMEFVDGVPIDLWCARGKLDLWQRLALFVQVARAVAYAHGRLVVHRDLKPSNVMVTPDGQTHLLDFGIAKVLDEAASEGAGLTQQRGLVMTPLYASPEQLAGEPATVQTDVYGLGVLLYELLTGSLPVAPARDAIEAIEQATLRGDTLPASARAKDPATARLLRGDIDWILGKALRRDPVRRYVTADAFADDVQRFLDNEPVLARPDSLGYRLRKAIGRHRVAFIAGAAVMLAVMGGAGAALLQARRAELASQRAVETATRAEVIKDFVLDVFRINASRDPANAALRKLPAEALLERGAQLIGKRFEREPALQIEIYGVVAKAFTNLARLDLAEHYARRALEAARAAQAGQETLAHATLGLARALGNLGRFDEAQQLIYPLVALTGGDIGLAFDTQMLLANLLIAAGRLAEAETHAAAAQAALDRDPAAEVRRRLEAIEFATALAFIKGTSQVEPLLRQAIDLALQSDGPASEQAIQFRKSLSLHLWIVDRPAEASAEMDAVLKAMRARNGPDDADAALEQAEQASMRFYWEQIPFEQAKRDAEDAVRILAARTDLPAPSRRRAELVLARIHARWGDDSRAYALLSSALPDLREVARGQAMPFLYTHMADAAGRTGRTQEAVAYLREAASHVHVRGQPASGVADHQIVVAEHLGRQGRYDEAERALVGLAKPAEGGRSPGDTVLAHLRLEGGRSPVDTALARLRLDRGDAQGALRALASVPSLEGSAPGSIPQLIRGAALCATGQAEDGRRTMDSALRRLAEKIYPHSAELVYWRGQAGLCALRLGDRLRATELARLTDRDLVVNGQVHPYFIAPAKRLNLRLSARHHGEQTPSQQSTPSPPNPRSAPTARPR